MRIRATDTVEVIGGRDRGKRGTVQRVFHKDERAIVEGVNIVQRHTRAGPHLRQAGVVRKEAPIHLSKIMLVCPHCSRTIRVQFSFLNNGQKVRVCKKCHEVIDQST